VPLKPGKSKAAVSSNIREFHKGKTYAKTRKKFGKKKADKQAVAVALSEKRRSGMRKEKKTGIRYGNVDD
jgi:hypothetical protein